MFSSVDRSDLFIRAAEGEELSRREMARLDQMMNLFLAAMSYDWILSEAGTISFEGGYANFYAPSIQWFFGNPIGRRKWENDSGDWPASIAQTINNALVVPNQRNVLGELDYMRGAADSVD